MILCFKHEQRELESIIEKMRTEITQTPYTCAIGLAMVSKDDNLDQACARADSLMYEDKARIKSQR